MAMLRWSLALLAVQLCWLPSQAQSNPGVREVSTADDLREAVQGGAEHVLITDHLDLSDLPGLRNSQPYPKPFNPGTSLQSVRVRPHPVAAGMC